MTPEGIFEAWQEALAMAYTIAKAERSAELAGGKRPPRFDGRGLHPYSLEWGRILTFEVMLPELAYLRFTGDEVRSCDPLSLRWDAHDDATREYAAAILAGGK